MRITIQNLCIVTLTILVTITPFAFASAGVGGRLKGKVIDKNTGNPLPGVTIRLTGSLITAITGENGEFLIIGIDAGTYDVSAEFESYQKITYTGFSVYPDIMNELDFELSAQGLRGEDVVLEAETTSSKSGDPYVRKLVSSKTFSRQPHRSLNDIILQSTGDVYQRAVSPTLPLGERYMRTDELFYRGGAAREAGYYMNALRLNDANSGGTYLSLPYGAIDQVTVQTGGYEAKYGQLGIGMTQIVPRRGGKIFSGSAELIAGEYERNIYSLTVGGPFLNDQTRFFAALDYTALEDAEPGIFGHPVVRYSTAGIRNPDPFLKDTAMFVTKPNGKLKYEHGPRPDRVNAADLTNLYVNVSYEPDAKMQFDLTTLFSSIKRNQFSSAYLLSPHGVPREERSTYLLDLSAKYFLSPTMFIQAHAGWYSTDEKIAARSFFDMGDKAIGILNAQTRGNTLSNTYYGDNLLVDIDREFLGYRRSESDAWLGGFSFNWQWNKEHLIESGVEFSSHLERLLDLTDIGRPIDGANNIYGYRLHYDDQDNIDVTHLNKDENLKDGPKKPTTAAFFIQDKYSIEKFTFSGGLRADYFSNGVKSTNSQHQNGQKLNESKSYLKWSPRIALSTEFSKTLVARANYGWFYHLPPFENYLVSSALVDQMIYSRPFKMYVGNPTLEPEKTEAIELGLCFISKGVSLDVTYFRNDQSDVITKGSFPSYPLWRIDNAGSRTVTGYNIRFENEFSDNLSGGVFAALLRSKTNTDELSSGFRSEWLLESQTQIEASSDHEQRTTLRFFADGRLLKGEGPLIGDIRPLQNTALFAWINWASGFPYTPTTIARYAYAGTSTSTQIDERNSRTTPSTMTVDLKIAKQFDIAERYHATLYVEVWNLLNNRNPVRVFASTGQPDTDGYLSTQNALTLTTRERQQYEYLMKDNLHYSNPRWINVGCKVEF